VAKKHKKSEFLENLKNSAGNISIACKNTGIARKTYYEWQKEDPSFADGIEDAKEGLIDFVESKLIQQINEGNTTAIIFFLKCRGRDRGYIERQEFSSDPQRPVMIKWAENPK